MYIGLAAGGATARKTTWAHPRAVGEVRPVRNPPALDLRRPSEFPLCYSFSSRTWKQGVASMVSRYGVATYTSISIQIEMHTSV